MRRGTVLVFCCVILYTPVVGFESEAPKSWKFLLSPTLENRLTLWREYGYILFLEHYGAV